MACCSIAIDVGAPQLEQLALAQTDEGCEHDEQPQALGHRVGDDRDLLERRRHCDLLNLRGAQNSVKVIRPHLIARSPFRDLGK